MKYKVLITDRDQRINTETGKLHDDVGLAALDSICHQTIDIEANNADEALRKALKQYEVNRRFNDQTAEIVE